MEIETSYYRGSGTVSEAYCFLAQRYERDVGFKSGEAESWVMSLSKNELGKLSFKTLWASDSWFTDIWRSPAGITYVSDADLGEVSTAQLPTDASPVPWKRTKVGSPIYGLWGLDDSCVFAWGSAHKGGYPMFRHDGKGWNRIADPGFRIYGLHGTAPDLVYAVGDAGQIARFDGGGWQSFPSPTSELLTSVFVVGGDEIYACGRQGSLLEGSATGWGKIAEGPGLPGPLHAVAKWNDHLWVGAGKFGLLRRVGKTDKLESFKPKVLAEHFDVRKELVATCPTLIGFTLDGSDFNGGGVDMLRKLRSGKALRDFT